MSDIIKNSRQADFSELVGETLSKVWGMEKNSKQITFSCKSGKVFRMFHDNECCEHVIVEDVIGDVEDIINNIPINLAEEVSSEEPYKPDDDSYTWTFYRIQAGGCVVTLRWLGTSNGYYSERTSFERVK